MKLHLPTTLRGALLACMACLASTAHAATYTATWSSNSIVKATPDADGNKVDLTTPVAGDTIIFNVTAGYFPYSANQTTHTYNANFVINSLILSNGSSNKTHVFNGTIEGAGTWSQASISGQTYTFNNSLSGFTGTLDLSKTNNNKINFNSAANNESLTLNAEAVKTNTSGSITFNTAYTVKSTLTTGTLTVNKAVTFNGTTSFSTLTIASGATATFNTGTLNFTSGNITNNGTLALGSSATMTLASSSMTQIGTYNVGALDIGERELNSVLNNLGDHHSVTYNEETHDITITNTGYGLVWNNTASDASGNNAAVMSDSNVWLLKNADGTTGTTAATFQAGDDLTLINTTNTNVNKIAHVGADMAAGTVTVLDAYSIGVNSGKTFSGTFIANEDGTSISKHAGAGTLVLNDGSDVTTLTASSGSTNINSGATVANLTTSGGTTTVASGVTITNLTTTDNGTTNLDAGDHSTVSDITVKGGALRVTDDSGAFSHNGSITVKNGDNEVAKFTAREDGATYANSYFNGYEDFRSTTGTATITNADLTVSGTYALRSTTLGSSTTVTVGENGVLRSALINGDTDAPSSATVTIHSLEVAAGGRLENVSKTVSTTTGEGDDAVTTYTTTTSSFVYTGNINLALDSLTDMATPMDAEALPSLSTSVLPGVMSNGSSLTINLDEVSTLSEFDSGSSFSLTLTGLTQAEGYTLNEDNLTVTGWEVDYSNIEYGADYTTFTVTKAVPEPTTATLSLLALAGLAARRRRK